MALRPHAILRLRAGFFTGGSHLTERTDNGLMAMLKGLAERPPVVSLDEDTTLVIGSWRYAGMGWLTTGDAALAMASAARARDD